MDRQTYRTTLTLPVDLALDIANVAKSLGVSQSALVSTILRSPVGQLAMYMSVADPTASDPDGVTLRLRGESREVVERLINEAVAASMVPHRLL